MNGIDPRLFGGNGHVANVPQRSQYADGVVDAVARAEIGKIKQVVTGQVWRDIQMLSKAITDLNDGMEDGFAQLAARVGAIERLLSQLTGGQIVQEGTPLQAANAQPGDEDLPPEYFQGESDESAP